MRLLSLPVLAAVALGAASASLAASAKVDPAPVVAAERAFAADGLAMGIDASFLKHSTADAILIGGGKPSHPAQVYDVNAKPAPANPALAWWPLWAGIAQSGDLGFTTGPIEVGGKRGGHYFTVWKKQPNGGWKWIYDGGVGAVAENEAAQGTQPAYLAPSTAKPRYPEGAMAAVKAEEARLAARAKADQKMAMQLALSDDAHVHVPQLPPARDKAAIATALATYPAAMTFSAPTGDAISSAGDLAFTYGEVSWAPAAGPARSGWYVHMWQNRREGWKMVFSQILPTPIPKPA